MNKDIHDIETADVETTDAVAAEADTIPAADDQKAKKVKKTRSAGAKRRLRYRANFAAVIAIAAVAVILLNVLVGMLADRFPITLDISANKAFSLSDESVTIAKQVKNDIELVIFSDKETFDNPNTGAGELDTTLREFTNALKQYNSLSGGKVTYSFLNPNQEPTKFAAYSKYEVQSGDILFLSGDRYKVRNVEDLYAVDDSNYSSTGTYEFESLAEKMLATTIYALNGGKEHIVQVLVGHDEDENVISGLQDLYELNGYTFEELLITSSAAFNKDASSLLIAAPSKDYSADEIKRVQDWLYNGGSYGRQLMVFVHPTADCPNLYEYLEVEYKVTVTDEIMTETDYERIQGFSSLYAMTDINATDYTVNSSGKNNVFTPYVRRLTTTLPSAVENGSLGSYAIPLTAYPSSVKLSKLEDLTNSDGSEDKSYKADDNAYPLTGMIVSAIDSYNNDAGTEANCRVLISGCSGMAYGDYLKNSNLKNEELLLDTFNTMTGIENAITISGKTISNETVAFTNATQLIVGLGVFTIGLPLVLLVICLIVFVRRKNL